MCKQFTPEDNDRRAFLLMVINGVLDRDVRLLQHALSTRCQVCAPGYRVHLETPVANHLEVTIWDRDDGDFEEMCKLAIQMYQMLNDLNDKRYEDDESEGFDDIDVRVLQRRQLPAALIAARE